MVGIVIRELRGRFRIRSVDAGRWTAQVGPLRGLLITVVATTRSTLFQHAIDPGQRWNPYPVYAELRRTPVSLQGDSTYVVSSYREVSELLRDPRISSDGRKRTSPPFSVRHGYQGEHPAFLNTDPPEHDHARSAVMTHFGPPHTPGRVEGLRTRIEQIVTDHIDSLLGRQRVDIVDALAFPLPVEVICALLGVPLSDAPRLHQWSNAVAARLDPTTVSTMTEEEIQQLDRADAEFAEYMSAQLAERHKQPGDDLLSALVAMDDPSSRMSDAEAISTAMLLMVAGHETTVNLISNGVLTFLRHPEMLERLRSDPLLQISAVEELLRFEPPVQYRERSPLVDMEVAGVQIPRGATLVMLLASANRDERRFANADQFIPDREDNQHLGFNIGIHYCFGAPLARLEAQIALREFLRRFERPALVVDPPPYRPNAQLRGPSELLIDVQRIRESGDSRRDLAA